MPYPGVLLSAAFGALAAGALLGAVHSVESAPIPSNRTVYDFAARTNGGQNTPLSQYKGKVLLIVNTASRCGLTPQYEGLETLYERYRERGFEVLAFPANDFMGQEPGTDAEIQEFCSSKFGAKFPLFSKIHVNGKPMHPLYGYLTRDSGKPGPIQWNFTKFLVGADGKVIERFEPCVAPLAEQVTIAIEAALPTR